MGRKKRKKRSPYAKSPRAISISSQTQAQQSASADGENVATAGTPAGNDTGQQSLAQKRAAHALDCVKKLENMEYGHYVSYVRALPAAILMNGLGQALAMEKANAGKDKGHDFLYRHMNAWLCNQAWEGVSPGWKNSPYANKSDILEAIVSQDEAAYIRAQAEALEYLEWLKKFAVAQLREKEGAD